MTAITWPLLDAPTTTPPEAPGLAHVTDHDQAALGRLAFQFKNKATFAALLAPFTRQIQEIEDALWDMLLTTSIDDSIGAQLDNLGKLIGCARDAHTDEQYRAFLKAMILVNRSSGTLPELLEILRIVLAAYGGNAIRSTDDPPACLRFKIIDSIGTLEPATIRRLTHAAKVGGVRVLVEYMLCPESVTFRLSSAASPVTGSARGFGSGMLTGALE